MLTSPRTRPLPRLPLLFAGAALLVATAAGAGRPALDLPVVAAEVSDADWRVPAAGPVADELERMLGSDGTRAFLADGLGRRAEWTSLVDAALADAGLPWQLAAVPLIESGYVNLGVEGNGDGIASMAPGLPGRGLWMFIPSTARTYGLRVDEAVDERLDPARETAAAVALLSDLHADLGDWGLALAAYNQGSKHVRAAIAREGTADVWELTERGAINTYAAQVMAASVLLARPELAR